MRGRGGLFVLAVERMGKGQQDQGDGRQALLAVDDLDPVRPGHNVDARVDVDDRADEVRADVLGRGADDVAPELVALLPRPAVRPLVDRDLELVALLQELEEVGLGCFHRYP